MNKRRSWQSSGTTPRRCSGRVPSMDDLHPGAYVAAFVAYVALGYVLKSGVLNWIVGPLWLVTVLHVIPRAIGRRR